MRGGPITGTRWNGPRFLSGATSSLRYITACQPRRLQWVMLMNPSFSNAPISNLLEATRSTELRLARNHAVLSFCVGALPMASLKTLSVMRHRHLCPCLSTMPKAIPSNSISNPSFRRDKGISCSSGSAVTIAESSPSWPAMRHASAGRALRVFCPRTQRRGRRSCPHRHRIRTWGNGIFRAETKRPKRLWRFRCRDKISLGNSANSGPIAGFREISVRPRVRGGGCSRHRTSLLSGIPC
jgi:hypothetical protein